MSMIAFIRIYLELLQFAESERIRTAREFGISTRGSGYLSEVMKDWMRSRVGGACQIASTSASRTARS